MGGKTQGWPQVSLSEVGRQDKDKILRSAIGEGARKWRSKDVRCVRHGKRGSIRETLDWTEVSWNDRKIEEALIVEITRRRPCH